MRKTTKKLKGAAALLVAAAAGFGALAYAAGTSTFTQTINPGTLAVDIVDGSYNSVANPSMAMTAVTFSFSCQTASGTFGTASEQIYVKNPDAADNGWTVSLAASSTTAFWDGSTADFDFNDPGGTGCTDGTDADTLAGQMTVDASGATLAAGQCASCTTSNITKGSAASFSEGTTDSITILSGAAASDDIGDWTLRGVSISQKIPAEQPALSDYSIDMTLTVAAN